MCEERSRDELWVLVGGCREQVVGWPPVRASRKNAMKSCKFVKVAVDGAPYLRKVDLELYDSYEHLMTELESMFCGLDIRTY